jgi:hypothetical protein
MTDIIFGEARKMFPSSFEVSQELSARPSSMGNAYVRN